MFARNRNAAELAKGRRVSVLLECLEERQLMSTTKVSIAPDHAVPKPAAHVQLQHASPANPKLHAAAIAKSHPVTAAPAVHAAAAKGTKVHAAPVKHATPTPTVKIPHVSKPVVKPVKVAKGKGLKTTVTGTGTTAPIDPFTLTFPVDGFKGTVSDATTFHVDPSDTTTATLSGLKYTWNFGDGSAPYSLIVNSTSDLSVYHKYGNAGTYNVSVSVTRKGVLMSNVATAQAVVGMKAVPGLAQWEANMISYGRSAAAGIADPNAGETADGLLGLVYYDAERVFYQIAQHTNDPTWLVAAQNAQIIYRDRFVFPNNGAVPGYWNFAKGLEMNYKLTGDPLSKQAVFLLASNAAYAQDGTPSEWTVDVSRSREVSYAIQSMIIAEELGAPHRARLDLLVNQALGHINQWFVSKTAPYVMPFMVGLTCEALMAWYDKTGDSRVIPAVRLAMDSIWSTMWDTKSMSFLYINKAGTGEGNPTPAPDLNMLIAPSFAWLYHQTGEVKYRDFGDLVFQGGSQGAYLLGNKQFDQSYRNSFDYVALRSESPVVQFVGNGTIDIVGPSSDAGTEGISTPIQLGSFTDSGQKTGTWNAVVDWGDGTTPLSFVVSSQGTLPEIGHTFAGHGDFTITERIYNNAGGFDEFVQHAIIADAPPVLSALSPLTQSVPVLMPVTFTVAVQDPHTADRATGYDLTWNFGDGTVPVTIHGADQISHIYSTAGTFTVTVKAAKPTGVVGNTQSFTVNSIIPPAIKPIPNLALWESRMLTYGQQYANQVASNPTYTSTDFDLMQILYQIADFTDQASWSTAIRNAEIAYRDNYVLPNNGAVGASLSFGTGLATDFLRTGDNRSRDALLQLIQKTSYTAVNSNLSYLADAGSHSQDVAFAILNQMAAADVGAPQTNWLRQLVNTALGHLDQWFVSKTVPVSSFNVSLTCDALYRYADRTGDPRILPAIQNAMDSLWTQTWNTTAQSFNLSATGTPSPAAYVNMLAAPVFAWLYDKTGNIAYRDQGDAAFAGGVANANIYSERIFAINYLFSFDYVYRRSRAPLAGSV